MSAELAAEEAAKQVLLDVMEAVGLEDWQRLTLFAACSAYAKTLARRLATESEGA